MSREFRLSLQIWIVQIYIVQAEAGFIAVQHLEIIQQGPNEIPFHVRPISSQVSWMGTQTQRGKNKMLAQFM